MRWTYHFTDVFDLQWAIEAEADRWSGSAVGWDIRTREAHRIRWSRADPGYPMVTPVPV